MSLPTGPAFWLDHFGITDADQFYDQVGQYLPNFTIFGFGPSDRTVSNLQYSGAAGIDTAIAVWIANARHVADINAQDSAAVQQLTSTQLFTSGAVPMAQLIIPNCFQVSLQMVAGGRQVENVVGVENAGGTAAGAAAAVLAAWKVASGPLAVLSNIIAMSNVHSVDIGSSGGAIVDLADTTAGGGGALSFATRGACALVRWNGATRNRSSRGRLYYGPISETQVNADGATLATASNTIITTAFTNFRNSLNGAGYPLVVLSRKLSTAYPVTSHAVESTIATQRRRIRS